MRYTRTDTVRDDGRGRALAASLLGVVMALTLAAAAHGQATAPPPQPNTTYAVGKGAKITGIIVSRDGDQFTVRDDATNLITRVTIVSGTRVFSPTGPFHLDKKNQSASTLIAGLPVTVYGSGGPDGNLIADRIAFRQSGLKVASQINAGEVDLKTRQQEIAEHAARNTQDLDRATARAREVKDSLDASLNALNKRINEMDSYDTKASATVNFASGSAALDQRAQEALNGLISQGRSMGLKSFTVEIVGYADATGSATLNERLSQRRADAVAAYLAANSAVPVRRIGNTVGLSTSRPVASNDTPQGRAENRRVEVKVLVNRGLGPQ